MSNFKTLESYKRSFYAATLREWAKEAKAARHERLHNPERAALLASLGVRLPAGLTVPHNAYTNFIDFNLAMDMAFAAGGRSGFQRFLATHHLRSRGKGRGKFVAKAPKRGRSYPHHSERECARRVSQRMYIDYLRSDQ